MMDISLVKFSKGSSIINALIWFSILTASCDIVLAFEVAGLTVRVSQLVAMATEPGLAFGRSSYQGTQATAGG